MRSGRTRPRTACAAQRLFSDWPGFCLLQVALHAPSWLTGCPWGPSLSRARDKTPRGKVGAMPTCCASFLLGRFLAGDRGLEAGARREARHGRRCNLDLGAGRRVAANACRALGRLEGAEADEGHGIALRHGLDDSGEDGVERSSCGGLAD